MIQAYRGYLASNQGIEEYMRHVNIAQTEGDKVDRQQFMQILLGAVTINL
jgi:hypothetical protein